MLSSGQLLYQFSSYYTYHYLLHQQLLQAISQDVVAILRQNQHLPNQPQRPTLPNRREERVVFRFRRRVVDVGHRTDAHHAGQRHLRNVALRA